MERGHRVDADSIAVPCYGWPLVFVALPGLWPTFNRMLVLGRDRAALFRSNVPRNASREPLWEGDASSLVWRQTGVFGLLRGETPSGAHFYVDAPSQRRRVLNFRSEERA